MIQKTLATLLILAALYGSYELMVEHQTKTRQAKNPWVARLTPLIKLHTAKQVQSEKASEASYLAIIYHAWDATENGYSSLDTVKQAAAAAGAETAEAARIGAAVHENIQIAKSMGVFSNAANAMKMERGEPPVAYAKGWEDERLVMANILSPVLAPEAGLAIPNLRLVPESIRNMTTERINTTTTELARKWSNDKIIYPETYRTIVETTKRR